MRWAPVKWVMAAMKYRTHPIKAYPKIGGQKGAIIRPKQSVAVRSSRSKRSGSPFEC